MDKFKFYLWIFKTSQWEQEFSDKSDTCNNFRIECKTLKAWYPNLLCQVGDWRLLHWYVVVENESKGENGKGYTSLLLNPRSISCLESLSWIVKDFASNTMTQLLSCASCWTNNNLVEIWGTCKILFRFEGMSRGRNYTRTGVLDKECLTISICYLGISNVLWVKS